MWSEIGKQNVQAKKVYIIFFLKLSFTSRPDFVFQEPVKTLQVIFTVTALLDFKGQLVK